MKDADRFVWWEEMQKDAAPSQDFSYLVVAIDMGGMAWIMDAAPGFGDCCLLENGPSCEDNGVQVPEELDTGVYRVENCKVGGGERIESPAYGVDYTEIEIWGEWTLVWGLVEPIPKLEGDQNMTEFERVLELMRRGFEAMEAETPVGENEDELEAYRATLQAWEAVPGAADAEEHPAERPVAKSYCNFR